MSSSEVSTKITTVSEASTPIKRSVPKLISMKSTTRKTSWRRPKWSMEVTWGITWISSIVSGLSLRDKIYSEYC